MLKTLTVMAKDVFCPAREWAVVGILLLIVGVPTALIFGAAYLVAWLTGWPVEGIMSVVFACMFLGIGAMGLTEWFKSAAKRAAGRD